MCFCLGPGPISNGDVTHQEQPQLDEGSQQADVGNPLPSDAPPVFFNPTQFARQPIQTPNI